MQVGKNYITNKQVYQNGNKTEEWYQFKVPIREYQKKVNGIQDFRSIRFMRMFLNDFDEEVVLRFARLELIRGEWRRYFDDLTSPGLSVQVDPNLTTFNIGAVNVEENDQREPVKYEVPPGITIETPSATEIKISGIDKQRVGQVAADIRSYRPPEPYKGKGVRYKDEQINLREGKKK